MFYLIFLYFLSFILHFHNVSCFALQGHSREGAEVGVQRLGLYTDAVCFSKAS